jgi:Alpha/beta hydrolase domain
LPKGVNNEICALFGQTIPYDRAKLVDLYGNADNYVAKFRASADKEVTAGFLLRPDADALIAEAEANRALFG